MLRRRRPSGSEPARLPARRANGAAKTRRKAGFTIRDVDALLVLGVHERGILERLREALRRRDVYATTSRRWADPRARLLQGQAWEAARTGIATSLGHDLDPHRETRRRARQGRRCFPRPTAEARCWPLPRLPVTRLSASTVGSPIWRSYRTTVTVPVASARPILAMPEAGKPIDFDHDFVGGGTRTCPRPHRSQPGRWGADEPARCE